MKPSRLRQLVDAERRLDVHHVVLEAGHDDVVARRAGLREALPRVAVHAVELSRETRSKISRLGVTSIPPSPVVMFLFGWKEKTEVVSKEPMRAPLVLGAGGVRRVLDHGELVPSREREDRDPGRRRWPAKCTGDDRPGALA